MSKSNHVVKERLTQDKIRLLEELSINAFPSKQTLQFDGWFVRLSKGTSKRLNSVNVLNASSLALDEKIDYCDRLYRQNNVRSVFKLTNHSYCDQMDEKLRQLNYEEAGRTQIMTLDLTDYEISGSRESLDEQSLSIELYEYFNEQWFKDYICVSGKDKDSANAFYYAWTHLVPSACFVALKEHGRRVAFGMGVLERNHIGLFGIHVDKRVRGRGFGRIMTQEVLKYAYSKSVTNAYLQVEVVNTIAKKLYASEGFEDAYQYYYLLKDNCVDK